MRTLLAPVLVCMALVGCVEPVATNPRPNILIIMWDTVRADRLSCLGYEKETTPRIDAFAKNSLVFNNMLSTSNWTVPSHASIFTGLDPDLHGAVGSRAWLDDAHLTLAERLGQAGYETWLFSANPFVSSKHNLTQGFATELHPWQTVFEQPLKDYLASRPEHGVPLRKGRALHKESGPIMGDALCDWLDSRTEKAPFFAFLNLMEAHWPWYPTRGERERFMTPELVEHSYRMDHSYLARYRSNFGYGGYDGRDVAASSGLYDAALFHLDQITGDLLDRLKSSAHLENTVVVIVSDHGDSLGEHGFLGHEYSLYDTLLRVPLIIHFPKRIPAGTDGRPVHGKDVFATLLQLAELPLAEDDAPRSQSLLGPGQDDRPRERVAAYLAPKANAVGQVFREHPDLDRSYWMTPIHSLQFGPWKLIRWDDSRTELYNTVEDPGEEQDLATRRPGEVARLGARLERFIVQAQKRRVGLTPADSPKMDEEQLERLRSLGYVGHEDK